MLLLPQRVALVIPCHNERQRLDIPAFLALSPHLTFVFVDDGSSDGTAEFIAASTEGRDDIVLLRRTPNQGKAEAVRQGMLYCLEHLAGYDWFGFWDADLATPLREVANFLTYQDAFLQSADAIFGSRIKRMGSDVKRRSLRHYLGRGFVTLVGLCLALDNVYDSQCGAKLFRPRAARRAFEDPFISRWIFDVEIMVRLRDNVILEYPLFTWHDVAGSKVHIMKDAVTVLRDLYRIRLRYGAHPTRT